MAGTRLCVQGSVLLALLLLMSLAAYYGLCQTCDEVCLAISAHVTSFLGGSRRDKFSQNSDKWLAKVGSIPLPRLKVATPSPEVMKLWKSPLIEAFTKNQDGYDDNDWIEFHIVDESDLHSKEICTMEWDAGSQPQYRVGNTYPLWICPYRYGGGRSDRIIQRPGVTIIHPIAEPKHINIVAQALARLDPKVSTTRYQLEISIMMEANLDWAPWGAAISKWTQRATPLLLDEYPCLFGDKAVATNLLFVSRGIILSEHTTTRDDRISNLTTTFWTTTSENVLKAVDDATPRSRDKTAQSNLLNVVLYVPSHVPIYVVEQNSIADGWNASSAIMTPNKLVAVINHHPLQDDDGGYDSIVTNTLNGFVHSFLRERCMGWLPSSSSSPPRSLQMDEDAWVPEYGTVLYLRHVTHVSYMQVMEGLRRQRNLLLPLASTLDLTKPVEQWWKVAQLAQDAIDEARQEKWMVSLELLEQAIAALVFLRSDPDLLEPFDFAMDHYLAVFAPLLFPLLLPFIGGMIREIKRYRDKTKK